MAKRSRETISLHERPVAIVVLHDLPVIQERPRVFSVDQLFAVKHHRAGIMGGHFSMSQVRAQIMATSHTLERN